MGWWPCSDCCGGGGGVCPSVCINNATLTVSSYTLADATSSILDDNVNFGTLEIPMYNGGVHDSIAGLGPWVLTNGSSASNCIFGQKNYDNPAAGTHGAPGAICGGSLATTTDCTGDVSPYFCEVPMDYSLWSIGVHQTDGVYIGLRMWPVSWNATLAAYAHQGAPNCSVPSCVYRSTEYTYLVPYTPSVQYADVVAGTALTFSGLGGYLTVSSNAQYSCSTDGQAYPIYNLTGSVTLSESYATSPELFCDLFGNESEFWSNMTGHNASNTSCGELWGRATQSGSIYTLTLYKSPARASGDAVCGWSGPLPASAVTLTQLNASGMSVVCDYYPPVGLPIDFAFRILT